jgi:stalled ribosome rescue protein Dom34
MTASHFHALVWIDHHEAKVFHFNATDSQRTVVASTNPSLHVHHKANSGDSGHARVDTDFLENVVQALGQAGAILITGPASAKTELSSHIKRKHPAVASRISAVETSDHPTDGELVAHGRTFFKADDRMHWQSPAAATHH